MNKTIIAIILGIAIISLTSAMFAGENYTFSINTTNELHWDVVGNSSNMDGFEVYQESYDKYSNITFITDIRMMPDNFTIILFENVSHDVPTPYYVSVGGGGGIRYIDKNITTYIYRNITKYIEKDEPAISIDEDETKFNIIPWIFLGLMIIYMIISLISSRKRPKKIKEVTQEDEE